MTALSDIPGLHDAARARFAHADACPFTGPRVFFESAGGSLTLKSVVETSAAFAAYPDNQGRANGASAALMDVIARGKSDARLFLNAPSGEVFVAESGTEALFRLIRTAALGTGEGGVMLGSTLEHPATRSAMAHWAGLTGRAHVLVPHDNVTGTVTAGAYKAHLSADTRVATIVETSPVTGIAVDTAAIAAEIRAVAPDCLIVVDGIQHASHGAVDVTGLDGYAISPYKVFSRHGYGIGWASDRLTALPREALIGGPAGTWELGTRDAGAYATFSDVAAYLRWLGREAGAPESPRTEVETAAAAINAEEAALMEAALHGVGNLAGLADLPGVTILGGADNPGREGVVTFTLASMPPDPLVAHLEAQGIRTHIRRNDHYCGNVLGPLGLDAAVRVSISHYNTRTEVAQFLDAMRRAAG